MRTRLLKAATLVVAIGFLVGATLAAGQGKPKFATTKQVKDSPDGGAPTPEPVFLAPTKAPPPMHVPPPAQQPPAPAKP